MINHSIDSRHLQRMYARRSWYPRFLVYVAKPPKKDELRAPPSSSTDEREQSRVKQGLNYPPSLLLGQSPHMRARARSYMRGRGPAAPARHRHRGSWSDTFLDQSYSSRSASCRTVARGLPRCKARQTAMSPQTKNYFLGFSFLGRLFFPKRLRSKASGPERTAHTIGPCADSGHTAYDLSSIAL